MNFADATNIDKKSGVAQGRDLQFTPPLTYVAWMRHPPICHPDRSVAEWRNLLFSHPLTKLYKSAPPSDLSSRPKRSAVEGPAFLSPLACGDGTKAWWEPKSAPARPS
jgi:hypothetical protein